MPEPTSSGGAAGATSSGEAKLPGVDPKRREFTPEVLDRTVIAIPLLKQMKRDADGGQRVLHHVVIDLNLTFPGGRDRARERVADLIAAALAAVRARSGAPTGDASGEQRAGVDQAKTDLSDQYVFASLPAEALRAIVRFDAASVRGASGAPLRVIHRIWPDFEVKPLLTRSVSTVKADAARTSFAAAGRDIVWAVLDSGVQGDHPHFRMHDTLGLSPPLRHRDFTVSAGAPEAPLIDEFGHGTHVAGIIAGELRAGDLPVTPSPAQTGDVPAPGSTPLLGLSAVARHRDESGNVVHEVLSIDSIRGIAPECTILSMKVLDANGNGRVSNLISALEEIDRLNGYGKEICVHGVNLSVGYDFDPEWFACGQSPLCSVVDRLARSGVVVVVAAGNTGYGFTETAARGSVSAGLSLSINDPGNAERAITVGSTHREMPHVYGVSYFSSKGPTGDGRSKPDLVAPGEKILSSAAGKTRAAATGAVGTAPLYVEDSGTSMAAPHVSGAIAAFLSIRREFIGQAEDVKRIFLGAATDLKRERYFQGAGLVDLMRAIQSV